MIHGIRVNNTDPKQTVCPWWHEVPWLKGKTEIPLGPGLNVIFGRNGSGKSTVLSTIAKLLCCETGDRQLIGQWTTRDLYEGHGDKGTLKLGVEPLHDGSPIVHFDPSKTVGLFGGAFDWDFGDMGIRNAMFKGSSGQTSLMRMDTCLAAALKGKWPKVEWKIPKDRFNDLVKFLEGDGTKVRPTLLMDEPSRSLDLRTEIRLFQLLQKIADSGVQVIIATHSVFALHMDGANFIETEAHYVEDARIETELHFLRKLRQQPKHLAILNTVLDDLEAKEQPKPKAKTPRKPRKAKGS